jgi:hypothetical protein
VPVCVTCSSDNSMEPQAAAIRDVDMQAQLDLCTKHMTYLLCPKSGKHADPPIQGKGHRAQALDSQRWSEGRGSYEKLQVLVVVRKSVMKSVLTYPPELGGGLHASTGPSMHANRGNGTPPMHYYYRLAC